MTITKLNLLIFSFLFVSCSVLNVDHKTDIINKEILRLNETYKNDKVYLDFNLNKYLIDFLEEKKVSNVVYSEFNNFNGNLSLDEIKIIFSDKSVKLLIEQIKTSNLKTEKLSLPKNINISNTKKEKSNIGNDGLKAIEFMSKKRIFLSKPAVTKDGAYSLVAYSTGTKDSMSGGIHIYKKTNNNWKFYTSVDGWIE